MLLLLNVGPTVAAELATLVVGEQKHTIREGDTTLVTQCTGKSVP